MVSVEIKTVVWIQGLPAFTMLPDGEIDWIAPDTATMYTNNKEFVDKFIADWMKENYGKENFKIKIDSR